MKQAKPASGEGKAKKKSKSPAQKRAGVREHFGSYLQQLRRNAGYKSLDAALQGLKEKEPEVAISRSLLHLLEHNAVAYIKPEHLKVLADTYGVDYQGLAVRRFCDRFGVGDSELLPTQGFVRKVDSTSLSLDVREENLLEIISVDEFRDLQARLPKGTEIGVAAEQFLDDNIYYDMVSKNIERGVKYYYSILGRDQATYERLVSRVEQDYPKLRGKVDGSLTHFIPKANLDLPINYVVWILPNGEVQGFIGMLFDVQVKFFQIADQRLSWRMFRSFCWALQSGRDPSMQRCIAELQLEIGSVGIKRSFAAALQALG